MRSRKDIWMDKLDENKHEESWNLSKEMDLK